MRIVFLGQPGSGKGTQSERLVRYLNIPHLSTGDMLRQAQTDGTPVGELAAKYLTSGRLVPDNVILDVVKERLEHDDCRRGCLFDGFPRTVPQAKALDAYLQSHDCPLQVVLQLHVPEDLLVQRLLGRGRDDDTSEAIHERFRQYEALTKPLVDYYGRQGLLKRIDGTGTPKEVFDRIKEALASVGPAGPISA